MKNYRQLFLRDGAAEVAEPKPTPAPALRWTLARTTWWRFFKAFSSDEPTAFDAGAAALMDQFRLRLTVEREGEDWVAKAKGPGGLVWDARHASKRMAAEIVLSQIDAKSLRDDYDPFRATRAEIRNAKSRW